MAFSTKILSFHTFTQLGKDKYVYSKNQVEAHYTTVINSLYTVKKTYILKNIWLAQLLRILKLNIPDIWLPVYIHKALYGSENTALFPLQCSTFYFLNSKGIPLYSVARRTFACLNLPFVKTWLVCLFT